MNIVELKTKKIIELHIEFKDNTTWSCELNSETMNIINWKRPQDQSVYEVDENGEPDFEKEVDSY